VKTGNGAFAADLPAARQLATSLVDVAGEAGLTTRAWITDMNQVLGRTCGNALEVRECVDILTGALGDARLLEATRMLSAELLLIGRLDPTLDAALAHVDAVLRDGRAAEAWARMVHALGGPSDLVERLSIHLPDAPVRRPALASRAGWITRIATRDIGLLVVELGGGRRHVADTIDVRVGLSEVVAIGQRVEVGDTLAIVHAADEAAAAAASERLAGLIEIGDAACSATPVLIERIGG